MPTDTISRRDLLPRVAKLYCDAVELLEELGTGSAVAYGMLKATTIILFGITQQLAIPSCEKLPDINEGSLEGTTPVFPGTTPAFACQCKSCVDALDAQYGDDNKD
jgi:hypothetical protein